MMLPLVVVGTSDDLSISVREATTTASGVDNAIPRLADTAERDYFTLRERLITMQKTTGRTQSILMSSANGVATIDGILLVCEQYALPAEYKCLK